MANKLSGYTRKRPDSGWWLEQIHWGEQYRKHASSQASWNAWRNMYRGDWVPGIMPVNLFFTMLRTTVPRVYFRDPRVSVASRRPGFDQMVFARILDRTDNTLLRQMKMKKHMRRSIQNGFLFGTGFMKVGFGSEFMPVPVGDDDMTTKEVSVETNPDIRRNMPWVRSAHPGTVVYPAGTVDHESAPWIAHEVYRPLDLLKLDNRFDTRGVKASHTERTPVGTAQAYRRADVVRLYEIRDRRTGKVIIIAPDASRNDGSKEIFFSDDPAASIGIPILPLVFNEDDQYVWGIPDAKILEPYQHEINEINTQIMKHRRVTLVKILAKTGTMSEDDADKLVSEDVAAVAWIQGDVQTAVKQLQSSTIPAELFGAAENVLRQVRETVGFSRNQFGEFNSRTADTTATEANIVRASSEIRVDERRDLTADNLVESMTHVHNVIFNHWTEDEVVEVVGPGGVPVWVKFRGQALASGQYAINVDPDSGTPETRQVREARAIQLYQVLSTNPLIDPIKLTQYLLTEMKGVAFDDMMRMLPPMEQLAAIPSQPLTPQEFGNQIEGSFQRIPTEGLQLPALPPPNATQSEEA